MVFESIIYSIPGWMNPEGPESEIVISSRARLARNIPGYPYVHRAGEGKLGEIMDTVVEASRSAGFDSSRFIRNEDLDDLRKSILVERHLISPALVAH
ncbi:MAG: ATP--guanido phosphotransferase, partial [Candidatus Latescibacterota bacterium]